MPKRNENRVEQLALALAAGSSVAAWCKQTGVPIRTAYGWAASATCKAKVTEYRRILVDRAVGRLTSYMARAVARLGYLVKSAESEQVQLQAARAILQELISTSTWSDLDGRLAVLEQKAKDNDVSDSE